MSLTNKNIIFPVAAVLLLTLFISCGKKQVVRPAVQKEAGYASWYGPGFHGRKTANGERYNMWKMTAAHKKLPFGTVVKVTNLENKKSVVVKINDRGPFIRGRIIDLSKAAAKRLDFLGSGTTKVVLEILPKKEGAGQEDS
jgi:rare lipoprotein A